MALINCTPNVRIFVTAEDYRATRKRVSVQFDKTEDTTLENIPGLSVDVVAGKTYAFEARLFLSLGLGDIKFAISGTATASNIIGMAYGIDADSISSLITAMDTDVIPNGTASFIVITGAITAATSGTLTVQFAQYNSNSTPSSVLVGSHMEIKEIM